MVEKDKGAKAFPQLLAEKDLPIKSVKPQLEPKHTQSVLPFRALGWVSELLTALGCGSSRAPRHNAAT